MEFKVDGRRVYAATGGKPFDAAKPAVVFVHGAAMDHTFYALQTRWFAHHGFAVLAVDLPGHGRSEGPVLGSIIDYGAWINRFTAAAGIGRAALVGHSLGSLAVLEAAAQAPERVTHLALLATAVPMSANDEFLSLAKANDHKAIELMNDWSVSRKTHVGGNKLPGMWIIGAGTRTIEQAEPGVLYSGLSNCAAYDEATATQAAAKVQCPVLIIAGDRDMMTPARAARTLAAKFAKVNVTVLPNCGHMMAYERPDETLDALRTFIAAVPA